MADKLDVDQIKSKYDLQSFVMDDLGAPKQRTPSILFFKCPLPKHGHQERTGSFAVYNDGHFHCFGCHTTGDIIKYVQLREGIEFKEALIRLGDESSQKKFTPSRPIQPQKPSEPVTFDMGKIREYAMNVGMVTPYLAQRRIHEPTTSLEHLGAYSRPKRYVDTLGKVWHFKSNRVVMPYIWNNMCYAQNERRDDLSAMQFLETVASGGMFKNLDSCVDYFRIDIAEKDGEDPASYSVADVLDRCFGRRFYRPEGSKFKPYGVEWFVRKRGDDLVYPKLPYAIITEGEFDYLSARSVNVPALAAKVGKEPLFNLPKLLQNVRLIFVAVDGDDGAGLMYADAVVNAMKHTNSRVRKMFMPDGFKDMNDLHKLQMLEQFVGSKPYYLDPVPFPMI